MRCEQKAGQHCPETWKAELEVASSLRGGASNWCCQCVHRQVDWDERPCNSGCPCWNATVPDGRTCGRLIRSSMFRRFAPLLPAAEQVRARYPDVCACSADHAATTTAPPTLVDVICT